MAQHWRSKLPRPQKEGSSFLRCLMWAGMFGVVVLAIVLALYAIDGA